jgi:hypothetical protein
MPPKEMKLARQPKSDSQQSTYKYLNGLFSMERSSLNTTLHIYSTKYKKSPKVAESYFDKIIVRNENQMKQETKVKVEFDR